MSTLRYVEHRLDRAVRPVSADPAGPGRSRHRVEPGGTVVVVSVTRRVLGAVRRLVGTPRPTPAPSSRRPTSPPGVVPARQGGPQPHAEPPHGQPPHAEQPHRALPDHRGAVRPEYSPSLDGDADPGEVVWTWVPYEEDPTRGKDRPVLVVGRDGAVLLGLMLTSKDHSRDAADEARDGRRWMDLGTGAWDRQGRPSEVRLDRVLRLDPTQVRREGAILDRALFDQVSRLLGGSRRP